MATYELNDIYVFIAANIRQICKQYGMNGNLFFYSLSKEAGKSYARLYIVAGFSEELNGDMLPKWVYPDDILRNQKENEKLFFPNIWVYDMTGESTDVKAIESLVEYLKKAEFIRMIYSQYNTQLPKALRVSEIGQLYRFWNLSKNTALFGKALNKVKKDLSWFFKRERAKGFRRRWLDYFRTEKFPDNDGPVAKIRGYFKQDEQILPLERLFETNSNINKLEMQEFEYKLFLKRVRMFYPYVSFAVGKVEVVDHGGVGASPETYSVFGKCVTAEEYAGMTNWLVTR